MSSKTIIHQTVFRQYAQREDGAWFYRRHREGQARGAWMIFIGAPDLERNDVTKFASEVRLPKANGARK